MVEIEGRQALALRATLGPLQALDVSGSVNLLPLFDAYVLGIVRDRDQLLPSAYKSQVYRPQGWISAVVLVDGYMKGVWEHKIGRSQTTVTIRAFSSLTAPVRKGIEAEADRLGAFLNTKVAVEYQEYNG
jgi:hypothetical protein